MLVDAGRLPVVAANRPGSCPVAPMGMVAVATDPAHPIAVKTGQSFLIALRYNPSTGYHWSMRALASTVVRARNSVSLADNAYPPDTGSTPGPIMVGVPATQLFLFDVTNVGTATVTFDFYPPGSATSPARSMTFTVDATPYILC